MCRTITFSLSHRNTLSHGSGTICIHLVCSGVLSALLWMHRPFLAMALLQHPGNPFESTYSQSVLAAQNSASFIIQTAARYLDKAPESILRCWDLWAYLPNAAVSACAADVLRFLGAGCSMNRYCSPVLGNSRSPQLRSRYMHRICHPTLGATWILRSGSWREERITRGTQG